MRLVWVRKHSFAREHLGLARRAILMPTLP
jgi:hypothetical protein